jgi:hypothetical protein
MDSDFARMQFDQLLRPLAWVVKFCVQTSDRALAQVVYRALMEKCRYMERQFGFGEGKDSPTFKAQPKFQAERAGEP